MLNDDIFKESDVADYSLPLQSARSIAEPWLSRAACKSNRCVEASVVAEMPRGECLRYILTVLYINSGCL